ncbi:uncharacterized protein LJ206_014445 [Theristicus caerulescens]
MLRGAPTRKAATSVGGQIPGVPMPLLPAGMAGARSARRGDRSIRAADQYGGLDEDAVFKSPERPFKWEIGPSRCGAPPEAPLWSEGALAASPRDISVAPMGAAPTPGSVLAHQEKHNKPENRETARGEPGTPGPPNGEAWMAGVGSRLCSMEQLQGFPWGEKEAEI